MTANVSMSNAERSALRRAIAAHPDWPAYRIAHGGLTLDKLSTGPTQQVARELGISVAAVLTDFRSGRASVFGTRPVALPVRVAPDPVSPRVATPSPSPAGTATDDDIADLWAAVHRADDKADRAGNAVTAATKAIEMLSGKVAELERGMPRDLNISFNGKLAATLKGARTHPEFETLLRACSARLANGNRLNVWISGPAGSGKTTAAHMAAEALGLEFAFIGSQMDAHGFVGYVSPIDGAFYPTSFTRMYEHGGVCLLDEIDGCTAEALVPLNAALAGDLLARPDGAMIKRHPDFVCIAAANTWGEGPNATYVGRARLDAATLDRFLPKLFWGYDAGLELDTCGNPDFGRIVQQARQVVTDNGIKVLVTPRASYSGAALIAAGFTISEALDMTVLANMNDDQKAVVRRSLRGL